MLFPYLNERPKGANYLPNAIMNYSIIVVVIYVMLPLFHNQANHIIERVPAGDGSVQYQPGGVASVIEQVTPAQFDASYLPTNTPYPTYTPYPTPTVYNTPLPSFTNSTPYPTQLPISPSQINFVFSYYYPDLVKDDYELYKANCHPDNIIWNEAHDRVKGCKDITASGAKWSEHKMYKDVDVRYRGGVAVPYYPDTYNPLYPMFSVITVTSPPIMAGDYLVIDICPACDDYATTKNMLFLDFVAEGLPDGVTFWDEVNVSKVSYPIP